jgi:DNA-directed RNA polymerase subunit L
MSDTILLNPKIKEISEDDDEYRFTLFDLNVSVANALRRIILTEIPVNVIKTETYETNQCNITVNTSRFHNEIVKQRIGSIPIHQTDLTMLPNEYMLEVDVTNNTENIINVTTEDFRLVNKKTGKYVTKEETHAIFPTCKKTNSYICFLRLRPKISETIPGEQIKLTADFSVDSAIHNSMYNVVSKCSYSNTMDVVKKEERWEELKAQYQQQDMSKEEIEFKKRNFNLLDAQRYFKPNSFDFVIQTIGIYDNITIIKLACKIAKSKFENMIDLIDTDELLILNSEVTVDNSYDVILENEDYTMGKVLEYILYERFYQGTKELTFCGFKKMHPHDKDSIVRIAFEAKSSKEDCRNHLKSACVDAIELFHNIEKMF